MVYLLYDSACSGRAVGRVPAQCVYDIGRGFGNGIGLPVAGGSYHELFLGTDHILSIRLFVSRFRVTTVFHSSGQSKVAGLARLVLYSDHVFQ